MKGLRTEQRSFPAHLEEKGPPRDPVMIADSFDSRTLANMELALDRACANVSGGEKHRVRRHIAARIDRCARMVIGRFPLFRKPDKSQPRSFASGSQRYDHVDRSGQKGLRTRPIER